MKRYHKPKENFEQKYLVEKLEKKQHVEVLFASLVLIVLIGLISLISALPAPVLAVSASANQTRAAILSADRDMQEMIEAGFHVTRVNDTLMEAKQLFSAQLALEQAGGKPDYSGVNSRLDEIKNIRKMAFEVSDELKVLEQQVNEVSKEVELTETKKLLESAKREFYDERYENAKALVEETYTKMSEEQARSSALSAAYEAASKTLMNFLKQNWMMIAFSLGAFVVILIVFQNRIVYIRLKRKIKKLELEKDVLKDLTADLQRDFFERGRVSESIYHIKTAKFGELIRDIDRQLLTLREEITKTKGFRKEAKKIEMPKPVEMPKEVPKEIPKEIPTIETKPETKPTAPKIATAQRFGQRFGIIRKLRMPKMPRFGLPKIQLKIRRETLRKIRLPKLRLPKIHKPGFKLPKLKLPKMKPQKIKLPKILKVKARFALPKIKLPKTQKIEMPKIKLPKTQKIEMPKIKLHRPRLKIKFPMLKIKAKLKLPEIKIRLPKIKLPKMKPHKPHVKTRLARIKLYKPHLKIKLSRPRIRAKLHRIKLPRLKLHKPHLRIRKIKLPKFEIRRPRLHLRRFWFRKYRKFEIKIREPGKFEIKYMPHGQRKMKFSRINGHKLRLFKRKIFKGLRRLYFS